MIQEAERYCHLYVKCPIGHSGRSILLAYEKVGVKYERVKMFGITVNIPF